MTKYQQQQQQSMHCKAINVFFLSKKRIKTLPTLIKEIHLLTKYMINFLNKFGLGIHANEFSTAPFFVLKTGFMWMISRNNQKLLPKPPEFDMSTHAVSTLKFDNDRSICLLPKASQKIILLVIINCLFYFIKIIILNVEPINHNLNFEKKGSRYIAP